MTSEKNILSQTNGDKNNIETNKFKHDFKISFLGKRISWFSKPQLLMAIEMGDVIMVESILEQLRSTVKEKELSSQKALSTFEKNQIKIGLENALIQFHQKEDAQTFLIIGLLLTSLCRFCPKESMDKLFLGKLKEFFLHTFYETEKIYDKWNYNPVVGAVLAGATPLVLKMIRLGGRLNIQKYQGDLFLIEQIEKRSVSNIPESDWQRLLVMLEGGRWSKVRGKVEESEQHWVSVSKDGAMLKLIQDNMKEYVQQSVKRAGQRTGIILLAHLKCLPEALIPTILDYLYPETQEMQEMVDERLGNLQKN